MSILAWSDQYQKPCVVAHPADNADSIIAKCRKVGAVVNDDGEEFVVELRPDIGPELWTENALRRAKLGNFPSPPEPRTPKETA